MTASHSRTVLSALPETIRRPSGLNATLHTRPVWPVQRGADVVGRCRRPTPAAVVSNRRRRCARPSGLNATLHHRVRCGRSADRRRAGRVSASHTRTVSVPAAGDDPPPVGAKRHAGHRVSVWPVSELRRSAGRVSASTPAPSCRQLPDTIRAPIRAKRHAGHPVRCGPVSGCPTGWPVAASHTRTVLSSPAGDDPVPSGAERHAEYASVWPVSGVADGMAGVGVPQPQRVVEPPETMRCRRG